MKKRKVPVAIKHSKWTRSSIFSSVRAEKRRKEKVHYFNKFCSQIFLVIIGNNFRSLFTKAERKGDFKAYRGRGRQPQNVSVDHNTHNGWGLVHDNAHVRVLTVADCFSTNRKRVRCTQVNLQNSN